MKNIAALTLAALCAWLTAPAGAAEDDAFQTAGGLAVYLGVLPAALVRGHPGHAEGAEHGGVPRGRHAYHIVAAVFDAATGARIEDAKVRARVTPRGLIPETRELEPMTIAGTVTYGAYFTLAGTDPYRVALTIAPAGRAPVEVEFRYRHGPL